MRRLAVVLVLVLLPASARASALDLFGYGARSPGLAGTGASYTDSYDALYTNPAGLAYARRTRLSVGFMAADYHVRIASRSREVDRVYGIVIGGDVPIPFGGALRDRVSFSMGIHVPPTLLSRARSPFPSDPFLALVENRGQVVAFMLGFGARITRTVAAGVGVISLAALGGQIDVSADASRRFTSTAEQQLLIDAAPVLGVRWTPRPRLALGLVFRGESKTPFDILVTNMIGDALPVTLPAIRVRGFAQYDPSMVELEGSYHLSPRLHAIAALAWKHWSSYPPPTEDPVIDAPARPRPGFSDTFVPKLAARYFVRPCTELRAGYRLELTPAPEQTGRENLLDNTRHILTLGAGWQLLAGSVPLRFDVYLQGHFLQTRRHHKDQTLDPADRDPNWIRISSGGQLLVGGFTMGVDL